MTRICMTEWPRFYGSSEADFRTRFAYYADLGIDTIRVQTGWLRHRPLINALADTSFKLKLILYVMSIPAEYASRYPDDLMLDEFDAVGKRLGPWSREFNETTLHAARAQMDELRESGLIDRVNELVVDLGPAGEGIYPANWTMGRKGEQAYWCYSQTAQADFRCAMQKKYPALDAANNAWDLPKNQRFAAWDAVAIPKPRTPWACGAFWNDILVWYRDSKRRMLLDRIRQTKTIAKEYLGSDANCIVYLPGHAYSQEDWDRAVREASGPPSIRLMMDNDWLMDAAIKEGCLLQYTGVENVREVRNIVRKLKAAGSDAYKSMWGENAGLERVGLYPMKLADVIVENELRGVDFTWSNWIFEEDGITPSKTFDDFAKSVQAILNHYGPGRRQR